MSIIAPSTHKNSKRITILRKSTFSESAQTNAAEFMSMSLRSIGSYFESKTSQGNGTGLTIAERKVLIPHIIDIPATDPSFMKACALFYGSLVTKVPYDDGITLEIGLELDNDKPVTYFEGSVAEGNFRENLPINIDNYVRYRHAIKHPRVASSTSSAKGNMTVDFYIFDAEAQTEEKAAANTQRDLSLQTYFKLKDDIGKVDQMLTLLGVDPRDFFGPNKASEKREMLRKKADERALEFNNIYSHKMFEEAYLVNSMINTGVIKKMGNQYVESETGKVLAGNEEEMLYFFTDKLNSDKIVILKGAMQEGLKKEGVKRKQRIPAGQKI